MDKFMNDNKSIRINRYVEELETAIEKYKQAKGVLENWSVELDGTIFKICSECSEVLYKAVEHFLREEIGSNDTTVWDLCNAIKDDKRFGDIELSVFVTKKEPRNASTHNGRLEELGDYQRVIDNLVKFVHIVAPDQVIRGGEALNEKFDYSKFWYDAEDFSAENTHYILMVDPVNDLSCNEVRAIMSLPWSIIIDFDGRTTSGKVRNEVISNINAQLCDIDNVKKQGISEVTFRLKKPVYISMEKGVAPRKFSKWGKVEKSNFDFFIGKSKTLEKDKAIVVVARAKDKISELFLEKIIDEYGPDNIKVIFLEGIFCNDEIQDFKAVYDEFKYYQVSSVLTALSEISAHQNVQTAIVDNNFEGILLPSYNDTVKILNEALINNLRQYFEIVDMNIGKEVENIYSEEDFLKGELISWEALNLEYDILTVAKDRYTDFIGDLEKSLKTVSSRYKLFSLLHKPGFGGTTLSRRIAWDIHTQFPVVILNNYKGTETWSILTALYEVVKKGILIIADESIVSQSDIESIQKEAQNSIFPVVLLNVSRIRYNLKEKSRGQQTLYLNVMEPEIYDKISKKCENLAQKKFDKETIKNRRKRIEMVEMQERCPLLIGLYFLDELFEGTEQYVSKFICELNNEHNENEVKEAMCLISMCDYFGQKKTFPVLLEKILNPTHLRGYNVKNSLKRVQALFKFTNINGCTYVEAKHYLLSKEIMQQLFIQNGSSTNWKDYIVEWSKKVIDLSISVCDTKIDPDLQNLLKDIFIENKETEYLKGKFSILLESCTSESDKEHILKYLAERFDNFINKCIDIEKEEYNEYQLLAHFWGHLGRFYSQKGSTNNFFKAEDCCKRALDYSERIGKYDYIILHIAGDSISKRIQMMLDSCSELYDLQKNMTDIREGISEAEEYFDKSIACGNEQYGNVGLLTLWSQFFIKFFVITEMDNMFNMTKIENVCRKIGGDGLSEWFIDQITSFAELCEYLEVEAYSETAQSIIYGVKSNMDQYMRHNDKNNVLQELKNYLRNLTMMSIKNSEKIGNVKRMIIRNILIKYRDGDKYTYSKISNTDKKTKSDLGLVLQYLDENINQDIRKRNDFVLWFKLMRYSEETIDAAIKKAHLWYEYEETIGEKDYLPSYYLYILYYIHALDGYSNSVDEAERFRKKCRKICEEKRNDQFRLNYDRVRDWLGNGKELKRLIDDREVDYTKLLSDERYMTVTGKFRDIDPSSRRIYGYMEIVEPYLWNGKEVFFKPNECGVSGRQIGHIFEFKIGFSLERLVAFDKSVKDISEKNTIDECNNKEVQIIEQKSVAIGDIVHVKFFLYQREKKRLKGIISENGKPAFLYKGEVCYERYIGDSDMEMYVTSGNGKTIEAKVIAHNDKFDFYFVSLKQAVLGESSIQNRDFYKAMKNIKIE